VLFLSFPNAVTVVHTPCRLHNFSKALPEHAWDLMIGGAAGGAAVLVSMPFDTIKTYLQVTNT
jgi:hypothetical protein